MVNQITQITQIENVNRFLSNCILKSLYEKNTPLVQKKIKKIIMKGPSSHDGPGEVYGYQKNIKYIHNNYYIKIGMSVNADYRVIKQWKAEMMFKLYTPYRRLTESVTHLLLDYCRKKLVLENEKEQIEWFHINSNEDPLIILNSVSRFSNMYSNKIYTDKCELEGIKYNKIIDYSDKQNKQLEVIIIEDDNDNDDNDDDNNNDDNNNDVNNNDVIEIKGIDTIDGNVLNDVLSKIDLNKDYAHEDYVHEDNKGNNITI
jgi:hypothetical protein